MENQALVTALRRDLDRGEAETVALALELNADLILMDEQEGRRAAERLGLDVIGVIGVLLEAKAKNIIDAVQPHLDALRQTPGFYISNARCTNTRLNWRASKATNAAHSVYTLRLVGASGGSKTSQKPTRAVRQSLSSMKPRSDDYTA